jgi:CRP-like cAMP-binding protein
VPIADRFLHEKTNLWVRPVILRVDALSERFLAFVKKHNIEHVLGAFERQFHREGEVIIRRGEDGHAAYVIVEGKVGVRVRDDGDWLAELGPGELFGEVSLLTSRARTANVVALTDVDLMVLERAAFRQRLIDSPLAALELLEMLGDRFAAASERLFSEH